MFANITRRPYSSRLAPIIDYPTSTRDERLIMLTVYYSKWISDFAKIIAPSAIQKTLENKKHETVPVDNNSLILETDDSSTSIGAILSQKGRSIDFHPTS
ncbi:hypothetical protein GJ496_002501 [Pomphorhynchus laevis]|nr:hypothetical protein GJ496_002501 [Pomphorhynchus laevis]